LKNVGGPSGEMGVEKVIAFVPTVKAPAVCHAAARFEVV
jgi:hypothetical protein